MTDSRTAAIRQLLERECRDSRLIVKYEKADPQKVQITEWAQHQLRLQAKKKRRA